MAAPDMTNVAYSDEYKASRREFDALFASEYFTDDETFEVGDGYTAVRKCYAGKVGEYNCTVSETAVLDASSAVVYCYRNHDNSAEFLTLIHHSDGHNYLLFRIDLYGYGVYDLTSRREFLYVPKESAHLDGVYNETFIWTDVYYNPANDVLAVFGCYWACPYWLILLRFGNPLEQSEWVDVHEKLGGWDSNYQDIEFVRWDGTTLVVKADVVVELDNDNYDESQQVLEFNEPHYLGWFAN